MVSVDDIQTHPRNPRRGDIDKIAASITANGFYGAVIVQRSTGNILAGNHRYRAAARLGMLEVPVIYIDVDDTAALRILLADNRTSDRATNDQAELVELLSSLSSPDGSGYTQSEIAALLVRNSVPTDSPEYDEGCADDVSMLECPHCQHQFPRAKYKA